MNYKIELRYGIIVGVLGFMWLLGEYFFGLHDKYIRLQPIITNFEMIIPMIVLPLGMRAKKINDYGGHITFWQALQAGVLMSIISGAIAVIGTFVYYNVINPHWFAFMIETSKQLAKEKGSDVKKAEEFAKFYYSLQSFLSQAFFGAIASGGFVSLIAAAVLKSKKS